jgi:predicted enzyme related to lactoylglutathione lyase
MALSSNTNQPIVAVLVHVSDVQAGLDWYQLAFSTAIRSYIAEPNFEFLEIGGIQLEIVPSDEKVSAGACGSVVYWAVPDLEIALLHMQSIGAKLYRGPMKIEAGQSMCQVRDPWGNCIGLRSFSGSANILY